MNNPSVTVIPASIDRYTKQSLVQVARKRVAAYARVSTGSDEQMESYDAQVEYYARYIQSNPDWQFIQVYADEAVTGTNTKRRDDFNRMVEDALNGKIDLIITKSISRFARNTVDTLTTVRKLKEKGIEIYFEKENIYTLDTKGELMITIMSSLAQEESRSISENVTWGLRKRMQDGQVVMGYKHFLGYAKGADGKPEVVEEEAKIVRYIYSLYLAGKTYHEIADDLTGQGIPTPTGNQKWHVSTVDSILNNEKYCGNAILQKVYTIDFLTKKQKTNKGEVPQYYVENSHPAIILPSQFELVQAEMRRRRTRGKQYSGRGLFFCRIICGECGGYYGGKIWHSGTKYSSRVWQCNNKYRNQTHCQTPHVTEDEVKTVFVRAWNTLLADKARYMAEYEACIEDIGNPADFDKETAVVMAEYSETTALIQECIAANAARPQNQEEYQRRYNSLITRYDAAKARLEALKREKQEAVAQREKLRYSLDILRKEETPLAAFDELLWRETVEHIIVHSKEDLVVCFKSGTEIHANNCM